MALTPVEVPRFGGLDLRDDPQEVGLGAAVDMLNVDRDNPGRLRARDGYAKFTTVAAAATYTDIKPYYTTPAATTRHLIATRSGAVDAINTSGAVVASAALNSNVLVPFGDPTNTLMYAIPSGTTTWFKWNGTTWAAGPTQYANNAVVQSPDNRMAAGGGSRVSFSDAGAPETFTAGNYVDVTPGDGQQIFAMAAWRELVFVFKQTKFFVFTGNDTSGTGTPVFKYRIVDTGVGAIGVRAAVAAPDGVYFVDRTGVYVTAGGPPRKVSTQLDPLFGRGSLLTTYSGSAVSWTQFINFNSLTNAVLGYFNGRLFLSLATGVATTNDRTFVLDLTTNEWMVWDLKVNALSSFRIGDEEEMVFALSSGSNDICRFGPSYTADAGVAISAKHRTGFWNPGKPGAETDIFEWELDGSGSVTVKTAVNDAVTLGTGAAVTLGTSPAIAQGRDMRAVWGRNVSLELSGTAPWSVSRVIANVRGQTSPGYKAA